MANTLIHLHAKTTTNVGIMNPLTIEYIKKNLNLTGFKKKNFFKGFSY